MAEFCCWVQRVLFCCTVANNRAERVVSVDIISKNSLFGFRIKKYVRIRTLRDRLETSEGYTVRFIASRTGQFDILLQVWQVFSKPQF